MNPNHYIAVCVEYLFGGNRPGWPEGTGIGKTLVSSSLIDRVASSINAKLVEVPVGFKCSWIRCSAARSRSAARRAPA